MGMKQILVVMAAMVLVVGCSNETPEPSPAKEKLIGDPIVEKAIREGLEKPEGKLTEADLEKVTKLPIWGPQITATSLKELAKLKNLTSLELSGTQITDAGLKDVAKLQQLRELRLGDTYITDMGLKELVKLQQLEKLDLRGSEVTKAGVAEFKRALPNCEVDWF